MKTNRLTALATSAGRAARTAFGLALVLAACSGMAQAAPPQFGTPEIDPGSMKAALMLLSGGVLLMADRFRRRSR